MATIAGHYLPAHQVGGFRASALSLKCPPLQPARLGGQHASAVAAGHGAWPPAAPPEPADWALAPTPPAAGEPAWAHASVLPARATGRSLCRFPRTRTRPPLWTPSLRYQAGATGLRPRGPRPPRWRHPSGPAPPRPGKAPCAVRRAPRRGQRRLAPPRRAHRLRPRPLRTAPSAAPCCARPTEARGSGRLRAQ